MRIWQAGQKLNLAPQLASTKEMGCGRVGKEGFGKFKLISNSSWAKSGGMERRLVHKRAAVKLRATWTNERTVGRRAMIPLGMLSMIPLSGRKEPRRPRLRASNVGGS